MERVWKEIKRVSEFLNNNAYNIKLTVNYDTETIPFLDLEIYRSSNQLFTRTYVKDVDRNGYVSTRSCHHPKWIAAIPKGRFIRIKITFHERKDYLLQSDRLIERFYEKGYKREKLLQKIDQIDQMKSRDHQREKNEVKWLLSWGFIPNIKV